jgi:4-alpha-glucanotransferase
MNGRLRDHRRLIEAALQALGVRNFVFGIHDQSFPSADGEELGRGSPYSEGARRLLYFVRELGFNGVQFGPQGETSESNPSPYDGTIFSRNTLSIALAELARNPRWGGLLSPARIAAIADKKPHGDSSRVQYGYAYRAQREALDEAYATFAAARARGEAGAIGRIHEELCAFRRENEAWLERDALYEPICGEHQRAYWLEWRKDFENGIDQWLFAPGKGDEGIAAARLSDLRARYAAEIERHAFMQLIAHEQHVEGRAFAGSLGLKLYGDLQIGYSARDIWAYQALFLSNYRMGAPPSRTNPEGQAWNYPVLDPGQLFDRSTDGGEPCPGPAMRMLMARLQKLFNEFDGVRVDHPHGLVCPWVYHAGQPDTLVAVRAGARLFSSPNLPDHPDLRHFAIAREDQLNPTAARYADDWVTSLDPDQVARYGALFDAAVEAARRNGRHVSDLVCEVLSTMPYPLRRVLEQHGLGRFRVTQKADLKNPADVYRSENAAPEDWIMVGNHDTKPIWLLVDQWFQSGAARDQAAYLAERLSPQRGSPADREALAAKLLESPGELAHGKVADLFASRAENVMIFFSDVFGEKRVFNAPGTVSEENWSLRVPSNFEEDYLGKAARGEALNLPKALAMALRAHDNSAHATLIEKLDRLNRALHVPGRGATY